MLLRYEVSSIPFVAGVASHIMLVVVMLFSNKTCVAITHSDCGDIPKWEAITYILDTSFTERRDVLVGVLKGEIVVTHREFKQSDSTGLEMYLYYPASGRNVPIRMASPPHPRLYFSGVHQFEESLILVDLDCVLFFRLGSDSSWHYESRVVLPNMVFHSRMVGKQLLLWCDQVASGSRRKTFLYYMAMDLSTRTCGEVHDIPLTSGAFMMFMQPRSIVSVTEGTVLAADVSRYRLYIRRSNGRDTVLERSPIKWRSTAGSDSVLNKPAIPQRDFEAFNEVRMSTSLIQRVALLSDTLAVVFWSLPLNEDSNQVHFKTYFDLWHYCEGAWKLQESDIDATWPNSSDGRVRYSNFAFAYRVVTVENMIVDTREHPSDDVITEWESVADYEKACQQYFSDHELRFALTLWKLK